MNAETPFALSNEPISHLSRTDLSDAEAVKDCAAALRRCANETDFAAWAKNWGDHLVAVALRAPRTKRRQPMAIEERIL